MPQLGLVNLYPQGYGPQGVGQGIAQGASSIEQALNQLALKKQFEKEGLPGFLASLSPQERAQYLKGAQAAKISQQASTEEDALERMLAQLSGSQGPAMQQQSQEQQPSIAEPPNITQQAEGLSRAQERTPRERSIEARLKDDITNLESIIDNPETDPRVRARARKNLDEKNKRYDKLEEKLFEATKDVRNEVTDALKDAIELKGTIELQQQLNEKGEIDTPGYLSFLKNSGFDIDALKSNDTQAFIKANGVYLKNLKRLFGGRITDREMKTYMSTIANEYQSPEGRRRILEMMKVPIQIAEMRAQKIEDIIENNGGLPPRNLRERLERETREDSKEAYKQFKKILAQPELPGQNRLITAGQAAAGKAVPILGGAGLGSLIGAVGGPVGSLMGSGIGAALGTVGPSILDTLRHLGG